ncbi:MAG: aminodeoxychorismate/anthranilate synthase component II, partial [Nitrosopumilaceae archaeon]|nr:aminodeoxychorismate/anthranilate synthase component II [Nitrosopumilaceae archaeon]NIU87875.1 aminodeoxychorismate/anthranilate synthase component II [Nitrosopumilaceae archaeon]NIX61978.1 aminodeoxychorismate/anthranilate synthase component II [Nitrosopumilaceae archaeon]
MILLIDNFDSFTYNLVNYLNQLSVPCQVVRNNLSIQKLRRLNFNSIVLSPGPQTPDKAGNLMEIIHLFHEKCSILGICLGHQA